MKLSYNWLKEYIDIDMAPQALADVLTMLGLETEGKPTQVGGVEGGFEGVVVGEVLTAEQHPNADRLRVCTVNVGGEEPLQIVCGAPNVAPGLKVPVATVGTTLHPFEGEAFKIKKGKIRGEASMGMICAEDELGIGTGHDGIMVLDGGIATGTPFLEVAPVSEDWCIEIDLTPNRIDAASHFGTARDLAAHVGKEVNLPEITLTADKLKGENPIPVSIEATEKCKRYTSLYIKGVKVEESPEWIKERLTTIGLRPRNNIVDITNYVLHELGHPLHAFDADQLRGGKVVIRTLDNDQEYITLDDETRKLKAGDDLMICDGEGPRCIAGTMGGAEGSVNESTTNIFLESAWFDPGSVRKTAKRLGIHSDSSYRFERGADPHMCETALLRAASLIVEIAGGTASKINDISLDDFAPFEVNLSVKRTEQMIGKALGKSTILDILRSLEIQVTDNGDELQLKVPRYRADVQRPQDVMEEILRIYGYDEVEPAEIMAQTMQFGQFFDADRLRQRYCDHLSATGFFEILNNSLVNKNLGDDKAIALVNPLSEELGIMRQSLLSGFLETIAYNQNRQNEDLALYEFGKSYWQQDGDYREKQWMCLAVTGADHARHWTGEGTKSSLFTLTREVERLQNWMGFRGTIREAEHPHFDYGLELLFNGRILLQYGKVKDEHTESHSIRNEVFFMEMDWEAIVAISRDGHKLFAPIPQYPSMRRDFSLLLDDSTKFNELAALIQKANPKLIRSVDLHDVYRGKGVEAGKKSYLVSVLFRDDKKTLQDIAVEKMVEHIVKQLERKLGARLRD
ncbi:MAG: phenylalanine--tRNA ligase subunit beta [Bacteroidia bacterium]